MDVIHIVYLAVVSTATYASLPVEQLPIQNAVREVVTFRVSESPSPFSLGCSVAGNISGVRYTWKKNGKPFDWRSRFDIIQSKDKGSLVFQKPRDDDAGQYQCFAESQLGVASTPVINVKKTYINTPKVTPLKHKPVKGKPFKLECSIPQAYPAPEIQWVLESVRDPSDARVILNYRITQSPDGSLWFTNITESDVLKDKKYVCEAKTQAVDGPVILAEHYIEDIVESKEESDEELVDLYLSDDMTVLVGQVTMIYCIYGGTPLAYPGWKKNGQLIKDSPKDRVTKYNQTGGKRLLIKDTWLEDEGNYTCFADNEVGKIQDHTIYLRVVSAPVFGSKPQSKLIAKAGEKLTIGCQILGVPVPHVSWTYNGQPLFQKDKISINQSSSGNSTIADLVISNVQKRHIGYYGCKGENDNGEVYAETLLYVL